MIVNNVSIYNNSFEGFTNHQMNAWKYLNKIPEYTNATYSGYTGAKMRTFPVSKHFNLSKYPNITDSLHNFEQEILQELKDCRKKKFGYIRALWTLCQNFGTGACWDSKFFPTLPGRDKKGQKQYANYNGEIVSANDVSNLIWGHVCNFMGIPTKIAQLIAKLDAAGLLELFSKGKFPSLKLLQFRDTKSDQLAIEKGVREFNINNYKLK